LKAIRPAASWRSARWFSVFLAPADEDASVAIQPGVGRFDDPAAGAPTGDAGLELDLLAAARMCGV